jgi:hypothetical protein
VYAVVTAERRGEQRAPLMAAVKQSVGSAVYLCQAGDISSDGMLIARVHDAHHGWPGEGKCWLEFSLPGFDRLIVARGAVVREHRRSRYHVMAVRFATIAPSHRRMIVEYARTAPIETEIPAFLS